MEKNDTTVRVLIAITEFSPVDRLWRAALKRVGSAPADLLALYLVEDHWQRAASLPFTREISRVSGIGAEFTQQRAEQLHAEGIEKARDMMKKLAAESNRPFGFEVLSDAEVDRIKEFAAGSGSILIAPSVITRLPLYSLICSLGCRLELIEPGTPEDEDPQDQDRQGGGDKR
jgi:hypothetical protein